VVNDYGGGGGDDNNWLKATHSYITKIFNTTREEPKEMPEWLTAGIMYLFPKSEDTKESKNY
jgi:hypothetical protein